MIQAGKIANAEALKVNSFAVLWKCSGGQTGQRKARGLICKVGRGPALAGLPTTGGCWDLILRDVGAMGAHNLTYVLSRSPWATRGKVDCFRGGRGLSSPA